MWLLGLFDRFFQVPAVIAFGRSDLAQVEMLPATVCEEQGFGRNHRLLEDLPREECQELKGSTNLFRGKKHTFAGKNSRSPQEEDHKLARPCFSLRKCNNYRENHKAKAIVKEGWIKNLSTTTTF